MKVSDGTVMTVIGVGFATLIGLFIFGIVYAEVLKAQNQDSSYFIRMMVVVGFIIVTSLLVFVMNIEPKKHSLDNVGGK